MPMSDIQANKHLAHLPGYYAGTSVEALKQSPMNPFLKVASNENMMGPAAKPEQLLESLETLAVYPDSSRHPLLQALAKTHQVTKPSLLLGNGSDECFDLICKAYLSEGDIVLSSEHTFSMYKLYSLAVGASYKELPMAQWGYDLNAIADSICDKTKLIFIANPNNPTGSFIKQADIQAFLQKVPSSVLVVLDEAYKDFVPDEATDSNVPLIQQFSNLVITRTFSKLYGLAGLRIGYAISNEAIIATLKKVKSPFNVNKLALDAAAIALKNAAFIKASLSMNSAGLAQYKQAASNWPVTLLPSFANFICLILTHHSGAAVYDALLEQGIISRNLASFGIKNGCRISIGTTEQNDRVIQALNHIFSKGDKA